VLNILIYGKPLKCHRFWRLPLTCHSWRFSFRMPPVSGTGSNHQENLTTTHRTSTQQPSSMQKDGNSTVNLDSEIRFSEVIQASGHGLGDCSALQHNRPPSPLSLGHLQRSQKTLNSAVANVAVWDSTVLLAEKSYNSQLVACRYLRVVFRLLNKSCAVGGVFWWLLPTPEAGGILKEKRQLWHFKGRHQKRWAF